MCVARPVEVCDLHGRGGDRDVDDREPGTLVGHVHEGARGHDGVPDVRIVQEAELDGSAGHGDIDHTQTGEVVGDVGHAADDVVLVPEVVVEGATAQVGQFGYRFRRRLIVAALQQQGFSGVQQLLTRTQAPPCFAVWCLFDQFWFSNWVAPGDDFRSLASNPRLFISDRSIKYNRFLTHKCLFVDICPYK